MKETRSYPTMRDSVAATTPGYVAMKTALPAWTPDRWWYRIEKTGNAVSKNETPVILRSEKRTMP